MPGRHGEVRDWRSHPTNPCGDRWLRSGSTSSFPTEAGRGASVFGVCIAYAYYLRGREPNKEYNFCTNSELGRRTSGGECGIRQAAEQLTEKFSGTPLMLVLVRRQWDQEHERKPTVAWGLRNRNEWVQGHTSTVHACLYRDGKGEDLCGGKPLWSGRQG